MLNPIIVFVIKINSENKIQICEWKFQKYFNIENNAYPICLRTILPRIVSLFAAFVDLHENLVVVLAYEIMRSSVG